MHGSLRVVGGLAAMRHQQHRAARFGKIGLSDPAAQRRLRFAANEAVLEAILYLAHALQEFGWVIVALGHNLTANLAHLFDNGIIVHLRSP